MYASQLVQWPLDLQFPPLSSGVVHLKDRLQLYVAQLAPAIRRLYVLLLPSLVELDGYDVVTGKRILYKIVQSTGRFKKKTGPCFISLYLWQFITVWTGNTLVVCCKLSLSSNDSESLQQTMSVLPVHTVINCQRYRLIKHGPVFF